MKLFSKKEKKAPAVKQATVEVDAEYYTHLLCKEYLIEGMDGKGLQADSVWNETMWKRS